MHVPILTTVRPSGHRKCFTDKIERIQKKFVKHVYATKHATINKVYFSCVALDRAYGLLHSFQFFN